VIVRDAEPFDDLLPAVLRRGHDGMRAPGMCSHTRSVVAPDFTFGRRGVRQKNRFVDRDDLCGARRRHQQRMCRVRYVDGP